MPIDFDALKNPEAAATPDDGDHYARLNRAALVQSANGERIVTEWQDEDKPVYWQSWNRFDTTGMSYTRDLLIGLGIDLQVVNDTTDLEDSLESVVGAVYHVTTKSQKGSRNDGMVFVTTYVRGIAEPVQSEMEIDTAGLPSIDEPDVVAPSASRPEGDDEDIPF